MEGKLEPIPNMTTAEAQVWTAEFSTRARTIGAAGAMAAANQRVQRDRQASSESNGAMRKADLTLAKRTHSELTAKAKKRFKVRTISKTAVGDQAVPRWWIISAMHAAFGPRVAADAMGGICKSTVTSVACTFSIRYPEQSEDSKRVGLEVATRLEQQQPEGANA